ncbi:IS110 family transposase [Pseudonocardia acaciae]|uniref:IS110 family transposase n=1 Tax=Pseudonocardia acaciae TaxID=551276 RepID=UPI001FDEC126|nr:IS110 family transposase [Pseudonocardia acaciae]
MTGNAIAEATKTHPWAPLLAKLPRIGTVNLGQVIGEIGPILERATSCAQLAVETGVAPVTTESGKHRTVNFRHAVNRRARQALTTWADNSHHSSDWAAAIYNHARARAANATPQHPHPRPHLAARDLGLLARDKSCYDPPHPPPEQDQHKQGVDLGNSSRPFHAHTIVLADHAQRGRTLQSAQVCTPGRQGRSRSTRSRGETSTQSPA